jgi:molecular chaperone DnaK (HSP70)
MAKVIGIDLGTSNSADAIVESADAIVENGKPVIIPSAGG